MQVVLIYFDLIFLKKLKLTWMRNTYDQGCTTTKPSYTTVIQLWCLSNATQNKSVTANLYMKEILQVKTKLYVSASTGMGAELILTP